jgi:hypothetical protein
VGPHPVEKRRVTLSGDRHPCAASFAQARSRIRLLSLVRVDRRESRDRGVRVSPPPPAGPGHRPGPLPCPSVASEASVHAGCTSPCSPSSWPAGLTTNQPWRRCAAASWTAWPPSTPRTANSAGAHQADLPHPGAAATPAPATGRLGGRDDPAPCPPARSAPPTTWRSGPSPPRSSPPCSWPSRNGRPTTARETCAR